MINVRNSQRKIAIDTPLLTTQVQTLLDALGYSDFDLGIWLTTNNTIRRFNKAYRRKDRPTDILSFPFHPELKAGQRIVAHSDDDKNLGDIIISLEFVKQAAQELGVSYEQRMKVLLVHGMCHLLGYDHILDKDYEVMQKEEARLLKRL